MAGIGSPENEGADRMTRKALQLPPTYATLNDNQDAYLPALKLRALAKEHGRYWAFHSLPTTVALPGNRFAKSLDGFMDHPTEPMFRELLREYSEHGVQRPTGYADVFHEKFFSPRVPWSINNLLAPCFAGGWQAALVPGVHRGKLYKYDLRSAYLWAATLGLPNVDSYRRCVKPSRRAGIEGLYRVKLQMPNPDAPFPFNHAYECIATAQEMEMYNLRVESIVDGVRWFDTISGDEIVNKIKLVSTWKQAARSYWGRWAQLQRVSCVAGAKIWTLPNISLNIPWAHAIVSRVKMKVWECSRNAVHVYVDSLITPEVLPTGMAVGDWRLEATYHDGVFVKGPGQYGALHSQRLERMAGVAKDSPSRNNPVALVA